MKFKIFGDSAYFDDEFLATGGGRGMSSVRESVEWGYKDLKTIWKVCDWRNVLKLRNQPVAKIMFAAFFLRIFILHSMLVKLLHILFFNHLHLKIIFHKVLKHILFQMMLSLATIMLVNNYMTFMITMMLMVV